jgi:hypothetical protein
MAIERKYGRVTTERGDIPADEPVIVFRARDAQLCPMLSAYFELCKRAGAGHFHLQVIEQTYTEMADWQEAHPDQVHTPDTTPEQMEQG